MDRFVFFGGKGGVGKTTVSSAYAHKCARAGVETLLVSTDPAHSTADVFDQSFEDEPTRVEGYDALSAMEIDPDEAVDEHLLEIRRALGDQVSPSIVNEIDRQIELAHRTPGAHEAALFDRFVEVMRGADAYDRVVFDTSPTGGTLRLLSLPEYLGGWIDRLASKREESLRLVSLGVGGPGTFDERGLLGVALHRAYADDGLLYTYTSEPVDGDADFSTMPEGESANHQSVVSEWRVPEPCNPDSVVDPATRRELLRVDEPQFNHDAGCLAFGPDGMLYVSLGDGGAADDQGVGHVPGGNGQDPGNVLGTILRIDPDGDDSANGQYGVPADNPFVDEPDALDEVFAYGFRNPFRFSFDDRTDELYVADVGQNDVEEVDRVVAGGNYGWRRREGSFCFDANGAEDGFVFECEDDESSNDLIDPVAEYDHDEGIAVVGGFVYRGGQLPPLRGRYVFGDFFAPARGSGRLFYLGRNDRNRIHELPLADRDTLGFSLLGFGRDADDELYVLANETGTPFGDTGVVLRVASPDTTSNFGARLSGDEEVPPVETDGRGRASFRFDDDATELEFRLTVANLEDVVAAHVHCAPDGVNGPVGVTLFDGGPVSPDGVLAGGTVTAPDDRNECGWEDLADVRRAMKNGYAYVNVHTQAHPAGEVRGQVR